MVYGKGGSKPLAPVFPAAPGVPPSAGPNAAPAELAATLRRNCLRETGSCGIAVLLEGDDRKCITPEFPGVLVRKIEPNPHRDCRLSRGREASLSPKAPFHNVGPFWTDRNRATAR